jgi:hypothetical protein
MQGTNRAENLALIDWLIGVKCCHVRSGFQGGLKVLAVKNASIHAISIRFQWQAVEVGNKACFLKLEHFAKLAPSHCTACTSVNAGPIHLVSGAIVVRPAEFGLWAVCTSECSCRVLWNGAASGESPLASYRSAMHDIATLKAKVKRGP